MVASHERQSASGRLQIVTDVIAHLGWSVIPVGINKKPLFSWKQYQKERPTIEQVEQWQKQYNPPAWAVITGAISNLVILDGDGEAGRETFEQLGINPHRKTGSGGWHCDFQHPGWYVPTLNSKSKIELGERWPGLDIRGDGGYAIFCGRNTSGEYTWLRTPGELDSLDTLPKNLRNFLGLLYPPEEKTRRSLADVALEKYLNEASMRGRDNACFALAKQLHDNNYSQSEAESVCMDFARRCSLTDQHGNVDPFTEESARQKVASAYSYAKREPWEGLKPNHQNGTSKHAQNGKDNTAEKDAKPKKEETALTRLMRIADEAHLICTPSGALYARIPVHGHHETVSIGEKGSGFRRWLVNRFKKEYGFAPNSDALSQTMSGVQADADYDGEKAEVYTRIAEHKGCLYLDLANDQWQCVEISTDGWRVITCPPVYFRRPSGMLPLPVPITGGSLDELRTLINAKDERDYKLITAWLVGTLHPKGPYPVLNLNGERGSAKTKGTMILRNLVDPNQAPARTAPKDDREAAITAQNNMIIALDNLSSMPLWLSDLLCRIATGSGFSARELYTDDGERVFHNRRPIIMNGIEDGIITQGDLLNRTIMVTLTPPDEYLSEEEIDDLFTEKHPSILGALLTVASVSLRDRRRVQLDKPPRMADFAKWVVAAEPALGWQPGTFMDIYTENQSSATSVVMESSPVARAIIQFMNNHKDGWKGFVGDLHNELLKYEIYKDAKKAPKAPNALSGQLRRIKSSLLVQGIDIQEGRKTNTGKPLTLKWINPSDDPSDDLFKSDDLLPKSDDLFQTSSPPITPDAMRTNSFSTTKSDDGDDLPPYPSAFYPPLDFKKEEEREKKEENIGRADEQGKTSSPSSLSEDAAIPDSLDYVDIGCPHCGCGLTRLLGGTPACVRCYPPKGYHTYSHLVDMIYPRVQKTSFGKKGA